MDLSVVCGASSYEAIQGDCKILAQVVDFVGTFPCCRIQASARMVNDHPDELATFMKATLKGYETYLNDQEATGQILSEISGQDKDLCIAKMYDSPEYDTPMKVSIDPDMNADEKFKALGFVPQSDNDLTRFLYVDAYQTALEQLIAEEPDNALWPELMEYFKTANTVVLS